MTGAELKTIRESLNLSAQALADILQAAGLLKTSNERTVRRWEDGTRWAQGVPRDVAAFVEDLNRQADRIAMEHDGRPVIVRFETQADWERYNADLFPHAYRVHAAALGRLIQIQGREGRLRARLVSMHVEDFEAWRFQHGMGDDTQAQLEWAQERYFNPSLAQQRADYLALIQKALDTGNQASIDEMALQVLWPGPDGRYDRHAVHAELQKLNPPCYLDFSQGESGSGRITPAT